ncbi:vacuole-associated enzyme activator complex component, partial [Endogone sp. FLAS-F59071]
QRLVRDHAKSNERIKQIIDSLVTEFAYSTNPHARNGGLIALAATTIALGQNVNPYLDDIVPPVLACFSDQDSKVRYYACESMYNIAKVAKGEILRYFNDVFDAMSKLAADAEVIVKTGADLLDRLIGDIVVECSTTYVSPSSEPLNPVDDQPSQTPPDAPASLPRNTAFSLPRFIPLLSERIYTQSAFTRQFLVKWIDLLNSIPDLELVSFLPRFLDGLIKFLNDPSEEVRTATSKALAEFLREIREAADLRRKARLAVRQTTSTGRHRRQIKLDAATPSEAAEGADGVVAAAPAVTVADDDGPVAIEPSLSGASENRDVPPKPSELIPAPPATEPFSPDTDLVPTENDKGDWVPGQGVIVEYAKIVEILMPHLSSADEEIQQTALRWINEFVVIAKDVVIQFTPKLITPVLPSLAHQNPTIKAIAVETNASLQKLILETPFAAATPPSSTNSTASQPGSATLQMSGIPQLQQQIRPPTPSLPSSNPTSPTSAQFPMSATTSSGSLTAASPPAQSPLPSTLALRASLAEVKSLGETPATISSVDPFDYQATVNALMLQLLNEHEETRVASLEWLLMLHKKAAHKILATDDGTFPALLKTLSDASEEVVKRDLQLLAQISSYSDDEYFTRFMINLLTLFSTDRRLLDSRGSLIIRQLCLSLNSERIYTTFAEILEKDEDLEFASLMVQNLNIILITSPELSDLRKRLKNLDTKDGQMLFTALYRSWCHSAVATFALCLLAQAYEHASNLLQTFAELDITVNFLIQIDKLVQLLESPVFTYLRLQLLEPEKYPFLFKCLYGILMLLPQSSAFVTLRNRLNSVSSLGFLHIMPKSSTPTPPAEAVNKRQSANLGKGLNLKQQEEVPAIRFGDLLAHFRAVQAKHEKSRRQALQSLTRTNPQRNKYSRSRGPGALSSSNSMSKLPSGVTNLDRSNSATSANSAALAGTSLGGGGAVVAGGVTTLAGVAAGRSSQAAGPVRVPSRRSVGGRK